MANNAFINSESSTGTCTGTAPAGAPNTTWMLTSLIISQAGPSVSANAKVTIWDGAVGSTKLFSASLGGPGIPGGIGSVGIVQDVPLPKDPYGRPSLVGTPGNALTIQVTGTGSNLVCLNARVADGLP